MRSFALGDDFRFDQETEFYAEVDLAGAVEVGCVYVERLAEFCLVCFEAGHEVECGQTAGCAARLDVIAGGFNFSDVLVVEEVEAFGHEFEDAVVRQSEALAEANVGFPCSRVAVGIAAYAVDAVVASVAVHAGCEAYDGCAVREKFLWNGATGTHGVGQAAVVMADGGERPVVCELAGDSGELPWGFPENEAGGGVAHVEIAGAVFLLEIVGIEDARA